MTYHRYTTGFDRLEVWPDALIDALRMPRHVAVLTSGAAFVAVGAVAALPFRFLGDYIGTPAVYVGGAGFALVVGTTHWASLRFNEICEQLRPVFTIQDGEYRSIIEKWVNRARQDRYSLLYSAWLYLSFVLAIASSFLTPPSVRDQYQVDLTTPLLTRPWYLPDNRLAAGTILCVLGVPVSLALGTAVRLLILNARFLFELRRLPVIPVPNLVRARLRPLIDLYVGISLAWTLGVSLYGVVFYRNYSFFSGLFIFGLLGIGAVTFAFPQVLCRRYITNSYVQLSGISMAWLYDRLGVELRERRSADVRTPELVANNLAELTQLTEKPRTWVYDSQDVVFWISSQAAALSVVFAQALAGRFLSAG